MMDKLFSAEEKMGFCDEDCPDNLSIINNSRIFNLAILCIIYYKI
jgi:hypothetical protein